MNTSTHPMVVAKVAVRIGFGVALALVGVAHYMDAATFAEAVGRGLGSPVLEQLGMVWGYLLPGLLIVGGVLIAVGAFPAVGTFLAGVGLLSIPAGLMLKSVLSGMSLNDTMPPAMNAIVWILFYLAAVHGFHITGAPAKSSPVKAPAPKPMMIAKAPVKKTVPSKRK